MRKLFTLGLSAILVGLFTITAYASIPGPDGTITGCYKPSDGKLSVIDSTATCPGGTNTLTWNQIGPQGPTGATGAQGPAGPPGPALAHVDYTNPGAITLAPRTYTTVVVVSITLPSLQDVSLHFSTWQPGDYVQWRLVIDGAAALSISGNLCLYPSSPPPTDSLFCTANNPTVSWTYSVNLSSGLHTIEIDGYPITGNAPMNIGPTSFIVQAQGS